MPDICAAARWGASGGAKRRYQPKESTWESTRAFDALEGCGHDLGEPFGGLQFRKLGGLEPARVGKLFVELRFARDPPRCEAQDDEMAQRPPVAVANHHLAMAGERDRLDR